MFKESDIVFVSNPDREYEKQMGVRHHRAFFGRVLTIDTYGTETVVDVEFPRTACGEDMEWSYDASFPLHQS